LLSFEVGCSVSKCAIILPIFRISGKLFTILGKKMILFGQWEVFRNEIPRVSTKNVKKNHKKCLFFVSSNFVKKSHFSSPTSSINIKSVSTFGFCSNFSYNSEEKKVLSC